MRLNRSIQTLALFGTAFVVACQPQEHSGPPRNLLLITMDSVRADQFASPELFSELPFALAHYTKEAQVFTGVSSVPATQPAIASLFTGRHPSALGSPSPDRKLPGDIPMLAEAFADKGYDTAAFVAPYSLTTGTGIERGFQLFEGPSNTRLEDYEVTQAARQWLSQSDRADRPWFLWVHLNAGHGPYRALETAFNPLNFFNKSMVPYPRKLDRKLQRARAGDELVLDESSYAASPRTLPEYQRVGQPNVYSRYYAMYNARVRVGDWFANELRHALKHNKQYDDTAVAIIGTHGEALGEHGVEFDHGYNLFDEVLRVPFMIRVPGRNSEEALGQASHVDFAPTMSALFALSPFVSSGHDLFSRSSSDASGHLAVSELYRPIGELSVTSVRSSTWSVLASSGGETVAFDLTKDAAQTNPLQVANQTTVAEHARVLERHKQDSQVPIERAPLKPWVLKHLQAIGYVSSRFE
ncbi:MAG: arylsulfatase A-like enzyme [Planctomycetota bacterium]|jgi:arylsulfatase A-like enzyme